LYTLLGDPNAVRFLSSSRLEASIGFITLCALLSSTLYDDLYDLSPAANEAQGIVLYNRLFTFTRTIYTTRTHHQLRLRVANWFSYRWQGDVISEKALSSHDGITSNDWKTKEPICDPKTNG
jgi:hypothetical protein